MKEYRLQKKVWTEADFEQMNWHDNPIHAIAFADAFQIKMDIDYIFEWVLKSKSYKFWIAPCTLIFENVYDVVFDVGPCSSGLTIDFITKENPQEPRNREYIKRESEYNWTIHMQEGTVSFKSVGFRQYVRQAPIFLSTQKIESKVRGGISFEDSE